MRSFTVYFQRIAFQYMTEFSLTVQATTKLDAKRIAIEELAASFNAPTSSFSNREVFLIQVIENN